MAVAGAVAVVGLGLPALNSEVPAARPVPASRPYSVGAGVTVVPPPDTSLDATQTRPGPTSGAALFEVGGVRYAIVASPFTGTLAEATAKLRKKIVGTRGYQVTGPEGAISTRDGVVGRQGMYASSGRDGRYAVFLSDGVDVEVTVAGNSLDLRPVLPAIKSSVRTITFGGS